MAQFLSVEDISSYSPQQLGLLSTMAVIIRFWLP